MKGRGFFILGALTLLSFGGYALAKNADICTTANIQILEWHLEDKDIAMYVIMYYLPIIIFGIISLCWKLLTNGASFIIS